MPSQTTTLPRWRRSWDNHRHAYTDFGDLTSTALCGHTGRTASTSDDPDALACLGCRGLTG